VVERHRGDARPSRSADRDVLGPRRGAKHLEGEFAVSRNQVVVDDASRVSRGCWGPV
jgi:hypothetical protein